MASQPWKQARDVIQARDARIIIIISVHQLQDHAAGSSVHARVNLTVSVGGPGVLTVTIVTTRTHTYSLALSVTAALHSAIHTERERERRPPISTVSVITIRSVYNLHSRLLSSSRHSTNHSDIQFSQLRASTAMIYCEQF